MSNPEHILQRNNLFKSPLTSETYRSIYYGEVISIDDDTEGGRIKVRIASLDFRTYDNDLPWCYPIRPRFFHAYPKVGELVRIFLEDIRYVNKARFWEGSIISQPHKIELDTRITALSTSNIGQIKPEPSSKTYPDATGVFPDIEDIALVGRVNTDIILKVNQVHIRAGKHENEDIFKLNKKNPAQISLVYEHDTDTDTMYSNTVVFSDKIALISHTGNPKFKAANLNDVDRKRIFDEGHPIARGDVLVEALKILRNAIIAHIHGYSGLPAVKDSLILELEKIDFNNILQENIVIN